MSSQQQLPLADVRVLDLGQYISGPVTGVLLAEMGADVIKVEPPEGDPFRTTKDRLNASLVAFNHGKRAVSLDLKEPRDLEQLYALARTVDVVIENFRPGVTERLRIDHATLGQANPRLIYCSITGFGDHGPYAKMPAYDGVALGYSGFTGLMVDPEQPRLIGPALADAITGHSAAFAIVSALYERQRTGQGHRLEVSMFGALVHFLHSAVAKQVVEGQEEGPYSRVRGSQAYVFRALDGKALVIHLSSPQKFWESLCRATGREDLVADEALSTHGQRVRHYQRIADEMAPVFASAPRDEWLTRLQAHEVPAAPVNSIEEALADEQFQALGIIDVTNEPGIGPMPRIRPPVIWDGSPLAPTRRTPFFAEHNDEVFSESVRPDAQGSDTER